MAQPSVLCRCVCAVVSTPRIAISTSARALATQARSSYSPRPTAAGSDLASAGVAERRPRTVDRTRTRGERSSIIGEDSKYKGINDIFDAANDPLQDDSESNLDLLSDAVRRAQRTAAAPDPFAALEEKTEQSAFAAREAALDLPVSLPPAPPLEDPLLVQFVGLTTKHGLKQRARRLTTDVLDLIRRLTNRDPMPIFRMAVERAMPLVGLRSVKVTAMKKASVPMALRERQRIRLAINAILTNADKTKPGRQRAERVAAEMLQICMASSYKDNAVLERKHDLHRQAVAARSNVPGARGARSNRPR